MKNFFIFKLMFLIFFNYSNFNCAELKPERKETIEFGYTFTNKTKHNILIKVTFNNFESEIITVNSKSTISFDKPIAQIRLNLRANNFLIWKIPADAQKIFINYYPYYENYILTVWPNENLTAITPELYSYLIEDVYPKCYYLDNLTNVSCDSKFYFLENLTSSILNLEITLKTCEIDFNIQPGDKKMIPCGDEDYEIQSILIKETNQRFNKHEFYNKKFNNNIRISAYKWAKVIRIF